MAKFTNPLEQVRVAAPCPADWGKMVGDERMRYCDRCSLHVYNLSGMTRREAEAGANYAMMGAASTHGGGCSGRPCSASSPDSASISARTARCRLRSWKSRPCPRLVCLK